MKRKLTAFLTLAIAAVMLSSLAIPAFADVAGPGGFPYLAEGPVRVIFICIIAAVVLALAAVVILVIIKKKKK